MGRRSKADLQNLIERILMMHDAEKLTHKQIAEILQSEGINISREAIRRAYKSATEQAGDLRAVSEEARQLMDAYRSSPNTDIAEAVLAKFTGLMYRELQGIESIEFESPEEAALAIGRMANAQARIGSVRMKFTNGFDAAKKAVVDALQKELKAHHPDLLDKLTTIVASLEAPAA
jgi:chromosome segregation and condensation protein ScpB